MFGLLGRAMARIKSEMKKYARIPNEFFGVKF